jgi:hypothetical protein
MTDESWFLQVNMFRDAAVGVVQSLCSERNVVASTKAISWPDYSEGVRFEFQYCTVDIVRDHVLERLDAVVEAIWPRKALLDRVLALNAWRQGLEMKAVIAEPTADGYRDAVRSVIAQIELALGNLERIDSKCIEHFNAEYQRYIDAR